MCSTYSMPCHVTHVPVTPRKSQSLTTSPNMNFAFWHEHDHCTSWEKGYGALATTHPLTRVPVIQETGSCMCKQFKKSSAEILLSSLDWHDKACSQCLVYLRSNSNASSDHQQCMFGSPAMHVWSTRNACSVHQKCMFGSPEMHFRITRNAHSCGSVNLLLLTTPCRLSSLSDRMQHKSAPRILTEAHHGMHIIHNDDSTDQASMYDRCMLCIDHTFCLAHHGMQITHIDHHADPL